MTMLSSGLAFRRLFHVHPRSLHQFTRSLVITKPRSLSLSISKSIALAGLLVAWNKPAIRCDAPDRQLNARNRTGYPESYAAPPVSSVSFYELGFGTVAGICAGVFIKKGAKAVAFLLGGVFVLLQYLGSTSIVRVDWGRAARKFETLFYTKDASGIAKPPNVRSLWGGTIDFLTADFQPRASFIAGLALGLRIG